LGFNLFVKSVLRLGALLAGFATATVCVGVVNDVFPWFWLPTLFGLAVAIVVNSQTWFQQSRLGTPFSLAMGFGAAFTFSLSTAPVTSRLGTFIPKLMLALGGAIFLYFLIVFLARGLSSSKSNRMTRWLLFPIIAACTVGYMSGGVGGSNHMVAFFMSVFHMSPDSAETVVRIIRKSIHVSAYGLMGLTCFRGAFAGQAPKRTAIFFALLITVFTASFDEMRQTTADNRTGSPWDVLLDMTGSFIFVSGSAMLARSKPRPRQQPRAA